MATNADQGSEISADQRKWRQIRISADQRKWRQICISADQRKWRQICISAVSGNAFPWDVYLCSWYKTISAPWGPPLPLSWFLRMTTYSWP